MEAGKKSKNLVNLITEAIKAAVKEDRKLRRLRDKAQRKGKK
jgi:hypothetical protein